ncbi:hypothetical protein FOA52_015999 [Chlamydomonas sp. UWO 241]|nr:hypothetical protein FOA52_015999 [Chlamydomonas sp. UWO 241]
MILQLTRPPSLPPVFEMCRPELKLAGMRIDPEMFSRSKMGYTLDMAIVDSKMVVPAPPEATRPLVGYPKGSWLNYVSWSPDSKHIAFSVRSPGGPGDPPRSPCELWVADAASGQCRQLLASPQFGLSSVFESYSWLDDDTIIAAVLPTEDTRPAPLRPTSPMGPKVQDNSTGKMSQNRTYPDLLKDEHDAALFEHYCTSRLVAVNVASGEMSVVGEPRVYIDVDPSPDGRFILVSWLERPWSYTVPCGRFPRRTQLWDSTGRLVREMAALPLAEDIPIAFNSCRKGPRGIEWRDDKPAEMAWIEAQDGGDPGVEVSPRDIMYVLPADDCVAAAGGTPPTPRILATTDLRCGGMAWCDDGLALVYESWWKTRRSVVTRVAPGDPSRASSVLFDRNYEDVYSDPGSPLTRRTQWGTYVLARVDGKDALLLSGAGASETGSRPFLDLMELGEMGSKAPRTPNRRLWQSSDGVLESLGSIMSDGDPTKDIQLDGLQVMLSRESAKEPPQTFLKVFGKDGVTTEERQVTKYPHPYPQLRDMTREVLRYPRSDGVMLTATLYLPPGYDKARDGPLPCILWAYPREFKNKDAAGQNTRSPSAFPSIGAMSPTLWVARGYAVLDGPTIPIVAEGDEEPNDTFMEQLVDGAKAVIDECERRGVVDPKRMSVGGHSYGAFMAANLLAHSSLFACGVARSGAYNRTLTPFGFQAEERTLWQAPDVYSKMSPYNAADKIKRIPYNAAYKIKTPLLLVHGEEDNNPGTFPMQSERLYAALKGHGAPSRLVILPFESHSYRARENVLHCLYEQDQWFERYAGYGRVDAGYWAGESSACHIL